jgi:uncharacterized protein YjiS (DUF1127 family)
MATMEVDMNISNSIDSGRFVRDWFATATERRELLALEDRMLRDVGLTQADVAYLVDHPALKAPSVPPHTLVRPSDIDPAAIRAYVEQAHVLRSQAYGRMFRAIWRWLRS